MRQSLSTLPIGPIRPEILHRSYYGRALPFPEEPRMLPADVLQLSSSLAGRRKTNSFIFGSFMYRRLS
jgi:hypothetical protein